MELEIRTEKSRQVIDVTELVEEQVSKSAKAVHIYVAHTTCAVTTADLDPGTDEDLLEAVWEMIPKLHYRHPHNPAHVPAHLISSIIGPGITIPVQKGRILLGTWQRIVLVELDGPKKRKLIVTNL